MPEDKTTSRWSKCNHLQYYTNYVSICGLQYETNISKITKQLPCSSHPRVLYSLRDHQKICLSLIYLIWSFFFRKRVQTPKSYFLSKITPGKYNPTVILRSRVLLGVCIGQRLRLELVFFLTFLLSSSWTSRGHRCRPLSPPFLVLQFFIAHRIDQSTARRYFIECCYTSRSRAFGKSICAHEKVPTNWY